MLRRCVPLLLNAQFLGQPCEIIEAPKLDQAPVKFFVISSSVYVMLSVLNATVSSVAHKIAFLFIKDFKYELEIVIEKLF